jgi:cell division protein FtsL
MSGLEQTFYIMSIVYMSVMFILLIALVWSVFVIRSKVNKIHDRIEAKIDMVTGMAEKGGEIAGLATRVVARGAKKAMKKAKK